MTSANAESSQGRVCFLDAVRYWSVWAVVVIHAAIDQKAIEWGWPVEDARRTVVADLIIWAVGPFIMPVLFFLAGYFAPISLARKGCCGFLWAKLKRLVVPGVLVLLLLNPIWRYTYHLTRGFPENIPPMNFWEYWPKFFDMPMAIASWLPGTSMTYEYKQIHLWFVSLLFVFFFITAVLHMLYPNISKVPPEDIAPPSSKSMTLILVIVTLVGALFLVTFRSHVEPRRWIMIGPFLMFQTRAVFYILYFMLGFYAYRSKWFDQPHLFGPLSLWLPLTLAIYGLNIALFLTLRSNWELVHSEMFPALLITVSSFQCMAQLILLVTIAHRYANTPSPRRALFARLSYTIYLIHLTIVLFLQWAFSQWHMLPGSVVVILVSLLSVILSVVASYLLVSLRDRLLLLGRASFAATPTGPVGDQPRGRRNGKDLEPTEASADTAS